MSTIARISIAEYDRMIAAGAFEPAEEHQVELIRGEIREMSPINPPHEDALDRLMYWSIDNVPRQEVRVRVQNSLGISELESVPQPDLIWVRQRDYSKQRPTTADLLLIAEVSESSLRYDRREKAQLYAEAGVQDYWIVNTIAQVVEVHRRPAATGYQEVLTFAIGEQVSPFAFPQLKLPVAELFIAE
jgi:Uma2 family endonuclease